MGTPTDNFGPRETLGTRVRDEMEEIGRMVQEQRRSEEDGDFNEIGRGRLDME